jgi:hypothetical protein
MLLRSVTSFAVMFAAAGAALAQGDNTVRANAAMEGDKLPFLCRDRDSVGLIIPIVSRAQEARISGDQGKAQSLMEVAARLQSEICVRPSADDVVILRCKLNEANGPGGTVSTIKVGAILRSDPAKVEQPFYAWTNATVDESGTLSGACTSEGAGDGLQVSPDILLRVQQRLYDFGLRMSDMNGQLTEETTRNIGEFQKWAKLSQTNQLNKPTLDKLFMTPAPSPWVTFAFDGFGNYAAATGGTRRNSELGAIEQLQRRSRSDYKVSSSPAPNCIGFAVTRFTERHRRSRTNFTQSFTAVGDSVDGAWKAAIDYCERERSGGDCNIRYVLCATGEDIRDTKLHRDEQDGQPPDARDDRGPSRREGRRDRRDRREDPDVKRDGDNNPGREGRFDPRNAPINSPPPRFDPSNLPANAPAPR